MPITINGESGKSLNATVRSPQSLLIDSWALTHESLAEDTFTWTAKLDAPDGSGTIIPDPGQIVEVFQDGVRRFRGHAALPRYSLDSVTVQVNGPWWWMQRVPISSPQTDGVGATEDRTTFVFPTQSIRTSIITLIDRAVALGIPISRGTVSSAYSVPKVTLSNMTFGAALAELMRWMPDAVAWFDYTGSTPALNVTRRADMTALTLTVGTNNVEQARIYPRLDQEVKRVELNYVDRNLTTGRTRYQKQAYGTNVLGKLQIVPISGPEIAAFLPKDDFDSVAVQTVPWNAITDAFVLQRDSGLASIQASVGGVYGSLEESFLYWTGASSDQKTQVIARVPGIRRSSDTGSGFPAATNHLVVSPTPLPEWAQKKLGAIPVTITGTWVASWKDSLRGVNSRWSATFEAMTAGATLYVGKWENGAETGSTKDYTVDWLARPIRVTGYLINTAYSSLTTIYKDWDYDYLTPPDGLAQGLQEAQDWVPWEGPVTVVGDEPALTNQLNRKLRVSNAHPDAAAMDALIRSITKDSRGRTTYQLGSPTRTDYGSLVNRIRREPADNIVYL